MENIKKKRKNSMTCIKTFGQSAANFPKIYKPHPNSGSQIGEMEPVPYCGPTVLQ
jgi:hypothetical protein